MSKIIVVTSGKGGVGKTTTSINLGAAINYFGKEVLVVDGNLTTPNLGIHLNSPEVPVSFNHVLNNQADLSEAIYEHESGIKIIPSSLSLKELKKIKPEKIKNFSSKMRDIADYVILDCSAGLYKDTKSILEAADEVLIVTNAEMPAITDALKALKIAEELKKPVLGIVVTRVRKDKIEMQPNAVKDMLEANVLGMIPEDLTIKKSLNLKDAVVNAYPKSHAARAYKEIASKILGVYYDSTKERERLLERFIQKLKEK